jgi:hypothetical protein
VEEGDVRFDRLTGVGGSFKAEVSTLRAALIWGWF